jgi:membrane associated rhomboid family serine protease
MNEDQRKIYRSLIVPGIFVIILWLVKIFEVTANIDLSVYGLYPLKLKGLIGVLTCPLLHADFSHLSANSIPVFFLGGLLFYFYREIAFRVFFLTWLLTGFWVWCFARGEGIHIGASGIVYGLASFLFFSGIIRRETKLMALTLLIAFLYGGLVWGVFPQFFPQQRISWESHLMGLLAGLILAIYYRKIGTQRKIYDWEDDNDDDGAGTYGEFIEEEEVTETSDKKPGIPDEFSDVPDDQPAIPPFRYNYKK